MKKRRISVVDLNNFFLKSISYAQPSLSSSISEGCCVNRQLVVQWQTHVAGEERVASWWEQEAEVACLNVELEAKGRFYVVVSGVQAFYLHIFCTSRMRGGNKPSCRLDSSGTHHLEPNGRMKGSGLCILHLCRTQVNVSR